MTVPLIDIAIILSSIGSTSMILLRCLLFIMMATPASVLLVVFSSLLLQKIVYFVLRSTVHWLVHVSCIKRISMSFYSAQISSSSLLPESLSECMFRVDTLRSC